MGLVLLLILAAVVGLVVKLIVALIEPRFADLAGLVAFLLVILSHYGGGL